MRYENKLADSDSENQGSNPCPPASNDIEIAALSPPRQIGHLGQTAHVGRTEVGTVESAGPPDKPPDKKRSPRTAATGRGHNRKSKKSPRENTTEKIQDSQEPDRILSVYDGRDRLATVNGTAGAFAVVMANGTLLGRFETIKLATAAISAAQGGAR